MECASPRQAIWTGTFRRHELAYALPALIQFPALKRGSRIF
jgi:hypothetical protein